MHKIAKRGVFAVLGTAVLVSTQAGVAYANQYDRVVETVPAGSRVTWKADGEHLLIKDTVKDGHSAVALFRWWDQSEGRFHSYTYFNRDGVDSVRDVNLDLGEGHTVNIKACVGDWKGSLEASLPTLTHCNWDWEVTMS
ncbi:hypothetical protein K4B79_11735 [Streptomyces lincolnensis]|uniref:hypothetical protein n=1 Tax=Streptomyces lincolnensis TaxID=1915 RepID=UPI001E413BE9|nr:hypothetical protein [Streptomyces lincolnensis]MCD7438893.1 hypothetical protein [Streptomyces lincolnensis]